MATDGTTAAAAGASASPAASASQDVTTSVTSVSVRLGVLLAMAGGMLDAYTYISRHGVFANSQTGNVVLFGVEAARGEWGRALRHLPPVAAFVVGVIAAEILRRPRVVRVVPWPFRAALLLEIVVLAWVGALPATVSDSTVTVMVAFVSSLQVSTFRTLVRWQYNTTMTTGNLRTASQAVFLAIIDHDLDAAERARAFAAVILAFLLGGLISAALTLRFGPPAVWAAAGLLTLGLVLFVIDEWRPRWQA